MILFFVGFFAFLLAGFGLGGGVLLIPALTVLFDFNQRSGQYFALISYIPAALGVILFNFKNNKREFYKVLKLIPVGIVGSLIGAWIAITINIEILRKIYGVFLIAFGAYMIFNAVFSIKIAKNRAI